MAAIRHLARAPITEAIVDFRVSLPGGFQPEVFTSLKDKLRDAYPVMDERRLVEARVRIKVGETVPGGTTRHALHGYFFKSADGLNVAQFRVDGFTYNRLAPYTSWDAVRPEALRLWNEYLRLARPEKLDRLALRYINRLKVPAQGDVRRFINVVPPYFPGAPTFLTSFLTRVASHDPVTGHSAIVTEALESDLNPSHAIVMLDIDVYTESGLRLEIEGLTQVLEDFHRIKNDIFFKAITEDTARLYE
jgi:uncharacterized protein (TIGR04255 family)